MYKSIHISIHPTGLKYDSEDEFSPLQAFYPFDSTKKVQEIHHDEYPILVYIRNSCTCTRRLYVKVETCNDSSQIFYLGSNKASTDLGCNIAIHENLAPGISLPISVFFSSHNIRNIKTEFIGNLRIYIEETKNQIESILNIPLIASKPKPIIQLKNLKCLENEKYLIDFGTQLQGSIIEYSITFQNLSPFIGSSIYFNRDLASLPQNELIIESFPSTLELGILKSNNIGNVKISIQLPPNGMDGQYDIPISFSYYESLHIDLILRINVVEHIFSVHSVSSIENINESENNIPVRIEIPVDVGHAFLGSNSIKPSTYLLLKNDSPVITSFFIRLFDGIQNIVSSSDNIIDDTSSIIDGSKGSVITAHAAAIRRLDEKAIMTASIEAAFKRITRIGAPPLRPSMNLIKNDIHNFLESTLGGIGLDFGQSKSFRIEPTEGSIPPYSNILLHVYFEPQEEKEEERRQSDVPNVETLVSTLLIHVPKLKLSIPLILTGVAEKASASFFPYFQSNTLHFGNILMYSEPTETSITIVSNTYSLPLYAIVSVPTGIIVQPTSFFIQSGSKQTINLKWRPDSTAPFSEILKVYFFSSKQLLNKNILLTLELPLYGQAHFYSPKEKNLILPIEKTITKSFYRQTKEIIKFKSHTKADVKQWKIQHNSIPYSKNPKNARENFEISLKLDIELQKLIKVYPHIIDFGTISKNKEVESTLFVMNNISTSCIKIELGLPVHMKGISNFFLGVKEGCMTTQIVPAGGHTEFLLKLTVSQVGNFSHVLDYTINGQHNGKILLVACVETPKLILDVHDCFISFLHGSIEDKATSSITLQNQGSISAHFSWNEVKDVIVDPSTPEEFESNFNISPSSGIILPHMTQTILLSYQPMYARSTKTKFDLFLEGDGVAQHLLVQGEEQSTDIAANDTTSNPTFGNLCLGQKPVSIDYYVKNYSTIYSGCWSMESLNEQIITVQPKAGWLDPNQIMCIKITVHPNKIMDLSNHEILKFSTRGGQTKTIKLDGLILAPIIDLSADDKTKEISFNNVYIGDISAKSLIVTNSSIVDTNIDLYIESLSSEYFILSNENYLEHLGAKKRCIPTHDLQSKTFELIKNQSQSIEKNKNLMDAVVELPKKNHCCIKAKESKEFKILFRPSKIIEQEAIIHAKLMTLENIMSESIAVRGNGKHPLFQVSDTNLSFAIQINFKHEIEKQIHDKVKEVWIKNIATEKRDCDWNCEMIDVEDESFYMLGPTAGKIANGEQEKLRIVFKPKTYRNYAAKIKIIVKCDANEVDTRFILLSGTLEEPCILVNAKKLICPTVPLCVESNSVCYIQGKGIHYAKIVAEVNVDKTKQNNYRNNFVVSFPMGNILSTAQRILPINICFISAQAAEIMANLEIHAVLEEDHTLSTSVTIFGKVINSFICSSYYIAQHQDKLFFKSIVSKRMGIALQAVIKLETSARRFPACESTKVQHLFSSSTLTILKELATSCSYPGLKCYSQFLLDFTSHSNFDLPQLNQIPPNLPLIDWRILMNFLNCYNFDFQVFEFPLNFSETDGHEFMKKLNELFFEEIFDLYEQYDTLNQKFLFFSRLLVFLTKKGAYLQHISPEFLLDFSSFLDFHQLYFPNIAAVVICEFFPFFSRFAWSTLLLEFIRTSFYERIAASNLLFLPGIVTSAEAYNLHRYTLISKNALQMVINEVRSKSNVRGAKFEFKEVLKSASHSIVCQLQYQNKELSSLTSFQNNLDVASFQEIEQLLIQSKELNSDELQLEKSSNEFLTSVGIAAMKAIPNDIGPIFSSLEAMKKKIAILEESTENIRESNIFCKEEMKLLTWATYHHNRGAAVVTLYCMNEFKLKLMPFIPQQLTSFEALCFLPTIAFILISHVPELVKLIVYSKNHDISFIDTKTLLFLIKQLKLKPPFVASDLIEINVQATSDFSVLFQNMKTMNNNLLFSLSESLSIPPLGCSYPDSILRNKKACPLTGLLWTIWLFEVLPSLVPNEIIDFYGIVGEESNRAITITNNTKKPISYEIELQSTSSAFKVISENEFTVLPDTSNDIVITCNSPSVHILHAKLICRPIQTKENLMSILPCSTYALRSNVKKRSYPISKKEFNARTYETEVLDVEVRNPYPYAASFKISISRSIHTNEESDDKIDEDLLFISKDEKNELQKLSPSPYIVPSDAIIAILQSPISLESIPMKLHPPTIMSTKIDNNANDYNQANINMKKLNNPFWCHYEKINLRSGQSKRISIQFAPLQPGIHKSLLILTDETNEKSEFNIFLKGQALPPMHYSHLKISMDSTTKYLSYSPILLQLKVPSINEQYIAAMFGLVDRIKKEQQANIMQTIIHQNTNLFIEARKAWDTLKRSSFTFRQDQNIITNNNNKLDLLTIKKLVYKLGRFFTVEVDSPLFEIPSTIYIPYPIESFFDLCNNDSENPLNHSSQKLIKEKFIVPTLEIDMNPINPTIQKIAAQIAEANSLASGLFIPKVTQTLSNSSSSSILERIQVPTTEFEIAHTIASNNILPPLPLILRTALPGIYHARITLKTIQENDSKKVMHPEFIHMLHDYRVYDIEVKVTMPPYAENWCRLKASCGIKSEIELPITFFNNDNYNVHCTLSIQCGYTGIKKKDTHTNFILLHPIQKGIFQGTLQLRDKLNSNNVFKWYAIELHVE